MSLEMISNVFENGRNNFALLGLMAVWCVLFQEKVCKAESFKLPTIGVCIFVLLETNQQIKDL